MKKALKQSLVTYQERVKGGLGREVGGKARDCGSVWGRGGTDRTQFLPAMNEDRQQKAVQPTVVSAALGEAASARSWKDT